MTTMTYSRTLAITECASCHITFGIPADLESELRDTHKSFYCPRGHSLSFGGQSDTEKAEAEAARLRRMLREERAAASAQADQLGATRRSLSAQKGVTTRIKNRIAAGVCPCCNRQFQNLHRHMSGQHPDFTPTNDAAPAAETSKP